MTARIRNERPEPWRARTARVRPWTLPFWAVEWTFEWLAYFLANWAFLEVLQYMGAFSVLFGVVLYFSESGDRLKLKHYEAWQVINTAQGKGGSGGRIEALQELNHDGIPLVGVDVSGAFLQGIRLHKANLLRSDFSAADLRNTDFAGSNFDDAHLVSANFRDSKLNHCTLRGANLEQSDMTGADLTGADLSGAKLAEADLHNANLDHSHWEQIRDINKANIYGVKNAPAGFVAWALAHGAVQTE
jgi:hypothetical protein